MSSILIREKRIGTQLYKLLWEKDEGFVVRENGYIVNHYGRDEKIARKKFSQKIYNIAHPKWKREKPYPANTLKKDWSETSISRLQAARGEQDRINRLERERKKEKLAELEREMKECPDCGAMRMQGLVPACCQYHLDKQMRL